MTELCTAISLSFIKIVLTSLSSKSTENCNFVVKYEESELFVPLTPLESCENFPQKLKL